LLLRQSGGLPKPPHILSDNDPKPPARRVVLWDAAAMYFSLRYLFSVQRYERVTEIRRHLVERRRGWPDVQVG
jgi:hypothetical protein